MWTKSIYVSFLCKSIDESVPKIVIMWHVQNLQGSQRIQMFMKLFYNFMTVIQAMGSQTIKPSSEKNTN